MTLCGEENCQEAFAKVIAERVEEWDRIPAYSGGKSVLMIESWRWGLEEEEEETSVAPDFSLARRKTSGGAGGWEHHLGAATSRRPAVLSPASLQLS